MKLYKYLSSQHLDKVLNEGVFLFRSLSYFQDYEDVQVRGDKDEGVLRYSGENGLIINNLTTNQSFKLPFTFLSKVNSEKIFIFSLSKKLCPDLACEFGADVCIEFEKPEVIISMLNNAAKPNELFHEEVKYYTVQEEPEINWALPRSIAMRKLACFSRQEEYRFIFSQDNSLEIGKTTQEIEMANSKRRPKRESYPQELLQIGNIEKYCKVHRFT